MPALEAAARAASSTAVRVDSTRRTWRSAPEATSLTARTMSPTARPVSSEEATICCEAAETVPALAETVPISAASSPRMRL